MQLSAHDLALALSYRHRHDIDLGFVLELPFFFVRVHELMPGEESWVIPLQDRFRLIVRTLSKRNLGPVGGLRTVRRNRGLGRIKG